MTAQKTTDLKEKYTKEIRNQLKEEFKLSNEMQIPRLHKIVINMGVGEASHNSKLAETIVAQLSLVRWALMLAVKSSAPSAIAATRGLALAISIALSTPK